MAVGGGTVIEKFITEYVFRGDFSGLRQIEKRVENARKKLDNASAAAAKIGAALTGAAVGTLKAFSDQQSAFSGFAARTGQDVQALRERYGDAVKAIASETGISFSDVVQSFEKAESAGLRGADAIDAVGDAARSQAAGIGSAAEQISLATSVTNAFGGSAQKALGVAVAAAQKGEGSAQDYAGALKGLVGLGSALDIDFSELAATLSATSQTAKSVPIAGTQIEAFLREIASPTETAKKELETLGLSFPALRKIIAESGLDSAVEAIQSATGGDVDILGRLFGSAEAQQFLLTTTADQIRGLTAEVEGAAGTAVDFAFAQGAEDASRTLAKLRVRALLIAGSLGERLMPAFDRLASLTQRALNWFDNLSEGVQVFIAKALAAGPVLLGLAAGLKGVSFALGPVAKGFGLLASGLTRATALMRNHRVAVTATAAVQRTAAASTGTMTAAQWLLNAAMLANPIGLVVAALAALVLVGLLVWRSWDQVKAFFTGFWSGLTEGMQPAIDAIAAAFEPLQPVFDWLGEVFSGLFTQVDATAEQLDAARSAGQAFGQGLGAVLGFPLKVLGSIVEIVTRLTGLFDHDWGAAFGDAWDNMKSKFKEDAKDMGFDFGTDDKPPADAATGTVADGVAANAEALPGAVEGAAQEAAELLPSSDAQRGPLSNLTASGAALPRTLAQGITQGAGALESAVQRALGPLAGQVEAVEARVTPILNPLSGQIESIAAQVEPLAAEVEPVLNPLVESIGPLAALVRPDVPPLPGLDLDVNALTSNLGPAVNGLTAPLQPGPPPAAIAALPQPAVQGAPSAGKSITFGDINMQISVDGSDSDRETAQNLTAEFRRQLHILVEQADSQIAI